MSQTVSKSAGSTAEGRRESEAPDRPMFFAASAMEAIDEVKDRLGERLGDHALDKARQEGRTLVTPDDVKATLEQFGVLLLAELGGRVDA